VILSKRIDSFYLFVQKRLSPLEGENAMRVAWPRDDILHSIQSKKNTIFVNNFKFNGIY